MIFCLFTVCVYVPINYSKFQWNWIKTIYPTRGFYLAPFMKTGEGKHNVSVQGALSNEIYKFMVLLTAILTGCLGTIRQDVSRTTGDVRLWRKLQNIKLKKDRVKLNKISLLQYFDGIWILLCHFAVLII